MPPDFWDHAVFSEDADPWDVESRDRLELGIVVRTDYADEEAWGRFSQRLHDAELEFAAAPEEDDEMAQDEPEAAQTAAQGAEETQDANNAMQEDEEESSDEEDGPAPVFHILNPSTPAARDVVSGISNLSALRLLNDVDVRPAPKPPAGTKPISPSNRLVDHEGWQEIYLGKQIWIYDTKSNSDGCVRVVSQSGDMYGTAA